MAMAAESESALSQFDDPAITAFAIRAGRSNLSKQLLDASLRKLIAPQNRQGTSATVQGILLAQSDQLFSKWPKGFGLGQGCCDSAMLNQAAGQIAKHRIAMGLVPFELDGFTTVSHVL